MIIFKKLRYKNFLSSGNRFTEILLDRRPNTLVIGMNGSGKSTMLDALTFGLYGKPFRNINKPTLVNSINEKELVVEIEFRINNKKYKVIRGIKPAIFEIWVDGVMLDQEAAAKDYQDILEKQILKIDYKAFTQVVILGSSSFVPFMQLSASDRRTIIEDLLGIDIFSSMNDIVKERVAMMKNRAADLKTSIENTVSKVEMQKKYIEDSKKNNAELIERREKDLDDHVKQVEELQLKANQLLDQANGLTKTIADEAEMKNTQKKLDQFEAKMETNINKARKDIEFYTKNSTCPTCDQAIQNKDGKITECNHHIDELNTGLDKLKTEYDRVSTRLIEINKVHQKVSQLNSELTRTNASIGEMRKYIKKITSEIEELKNKKVLSDDMMAVSKELVTSLEKLSEERRELNEARNYIDVASTLLKDSGIKAKIIKQYLPVINKLVNKHLAAMDFFVNFEIDSEFKESIKSRHRDLFSYYNFSEGEKQRIDLALLFTWRAVAKMKNSMSTNLLILDEVFDSSLDANSVENVIKIIGTLENSNIFIISHRGDLFQDKFQNVLEFKKEKNFSQMHVTK